jgi:hypothetical protein
MVLADGAGTPLGVHLERASPAEVKLVAATMAGGPGQDRGPQTRQAAAAHLRSRAWQLLLVGRYA